MNTSYPTALPQRRWLAVAGFAAVALIPLAFTGLFVAAIGDGDSAIDNIPVAIVNNDEIQTTTALGGEEQVVFAGRQLVTELTGADGFDWTITNSANAEEALARGDVYAILTVPKEFSESILSLSTDDPTQAEIAIRTDDSHSYLTGSVAQVVGQSMTDAFGRAITSQYIDGIYASLGELGGALSTAADGATELSDGAKDFTTSLTTYTSGVDSLVSGLQELDNGAGDLSALTNGVESYTSSVSQLSSTLTSINPAIQAELTDPQLKGALQAVVDRLKRAAAGGGTLTSQTADAVNGIQYGIFQSSSGAAQLASGSAALTDGATGISTGATELATGLSEGAAQVPSGDGDSTNEVTGDSANDGASSSADIASEPVTLAVSTDNEVTEPAQAIATFFIPLGLWMGALAVFLVLRQPTYRSLSSTARDGRDCCLNAPASIHTGSHSSNSACVASSRWRGRRLGATASNRWIRTPDRALICRTPFPFDGGTRARRIDHFALPLGDSAHLDRWHLSHRGSRGSLPSSKPVLAADVRSRRDARDPVWR